MEPCPDCLTARTTVVRGGHVLLRLRTLLYWWSFTMTTLCLTYWAIWERGASPWLGLSAASLALVYYGVLVNIAKLRPTQTSPELPTEKSHP